MKRAIFVIIVICLSTINVFSQDKAFRFHITFTTLRVKEDGKWGKWGELGTMNKDMDNNVLIDFTNKRITWDFKYKDETRKFKTSDISKIKKDTTYESLGFFAMLFETKEGNISSHCKLAFLACEDASSYTLVVLTDNIETKYYLKEID